MLWGRRSVGSLGVALLVALAFSSSAEADLVFPGGSGEGAGQTQSPGAIAVDPASGALYVADAGNNRIDVFEADGTFVRAFGWGVADGVTAALQVCTSECHKGIAGSGAGQLKSPDGIAFDKDPASPSHGDLYVLESANHRVSRFSAAGAFVLAFGDGVDQTSGGDVCTALSGDVCTVAVKGDAPGQLNSFPNIAVGVGGTVFVADNTSSNPRAVRVQAFDSSGALSGEPLHDPTNQTVLALATDPAGNFYLAVTSEGVKKYNPAGSCLNCGSPPDPSVNINAIALDAAGNLFIADNTEATTSVYRYDPSGSLAHVLYGNGTLQSRAISLAPYTDANGELFAIEGSNPARIVQVASEAPGPVVLPFAAQVGPGETSGTGTRASSRDNVRATLAARVNAEGAASHLHFEFVDDATYQASGFTAAKRLPKAAGEDPAIGADFKAHDVSLPIACPSPEAELAKKIEAGECLQAETVYHLRAVASNADGVSVGPEATFKTLPPVQTGPIWSTEVGAGAARLHAQINPTGILAQVRFEYVSEAGYEKDIEEGGEGFGLATQTSELDAGAGTAPISRSALVHGLSPETTYRYRYIASDFFGEFPGPGASFTTRALEGPPAPSCPNQAFRNGEGARLPDCRAYELVSPLEKEGADIVSGKENQPTALEHPRAGIDQAALDGDGLGYAVARSIGAVESAPIVAEYLAQRDPQTGWSSRSLDAPREGPTLYNLGGTPLESFFGAFSENLCSAWFVQDTDLALTEGAPAGVPSLYRRLAYGSPELCGGGGGCPVGGQATAGGCYQLLSGVQPPGFGAEAEEISQYRPILGGFSEDGASAAFRAPAALTAGARTVQIGQELSCTALTPLSENGEEVAFQWLRGGLAIKGATKSTYKPSTISVTNPASSKGDAGGSIQCQATATNKGAGAGAVQMGDPALVVAPFPAQAPPQAPTTIPAPGTSAPLSVGGGGGQTLSCDPRQARWEGEPGFAYQWYRDGVAIGGAISPTYTVSGPDVAVPAAFQCAVVGTNAGGGVARASKSIATTPAPSILFFGNVVAATPGPEPRVLDLFRVYMKGAGGDLRLASVLPDGEAAETHAAVGTAQVRGGGTRIYDSVAGALARDGSRLFWSAEVAAPSVPAHNAGLVRPSRLYLRLNPAAAESGAKDGAGDCVPEAGAACTIAISKGAAIFRGADPEATKALYSEGEDLYEVDVGKAIAGEAEASVKIAGKVKGLLGASEDLARVYLVSEEDRDGAGPAQAGRFNLYLREGGGGFTFVAALLGGGWKSEPEGDEEGSTSDVRSISRFPANRSSRVSGDGLHAAFMSDSAALAAQTAGYDNTDANSGQADAEVYLYGAEEDTLRCISCNPSGERPRGRSLRRGGEDKEMVWTAADIAGWETQWHASRLLSADGSKLFFESFEGLVSRDTNGKRDVYEWERAKDKQGCGEVGAEVFVASAGGCLSLISSGQSGGDAELLDASASGSDVFFSTASSLLAEDPGLVDIYDARVGGGFPAPPAEPPECEGEACQSPPGAPEDPTPASAAFQGAGNLSGGGGHGRCKKRAAKKSGRASAKGHKKRPGRCPGHAKAKRRAQR